MNAIAAQRRYERSEPELSWGEGTVIVDSSLRADEDRTACATFRVIGMIGTGGMGIVYLAERTSDLEWVALKVMRPEYANDSLLRERLHREAEAVRRIRHPNVVSLLDEGEAPGVGPFVAFEYLDGLSLATRLATDRRLAPDEALDVIDQVLAALQAAHAVGVIHRDLKPDNVHIVNGRTNTEGRPLVKVLDFGISRVMADCDDLASCKLTKTGTVVGTPIYMAPEQALGDGRQDHRIDIYAAGVVLYEMLSGDTPHDGANYNQVLAHVLSQEPVPLCERAPWIPGPLAAIVHRAMAKEPSDRYPTAGAFRDALRAYRAELARAHVPMSLESLRAVTEQSPRVSIPAPTPVPSIDAIAAPNIARWRRRGAVALGAALALATCLVGAVASSRPSVATMPLMQPIAIAPRIGPEPSMADAPAIHRRVGGSITHPRHATVATRRTGHRAPPRAAAPEATVITIDARNPYRAP